MFYSAAYAAFENVMNTMLAFAPAFLVAMMMLEGRYSGKRHWFGHAFALQAVILVILVFRYLTLPGYARFAEGAGILGMEAFQRFAMGTIAGVFIGSAFILIGDWLKQKTPNGIPPRRIGIPWLRRKPSITDESNSNVIPIRQRPAA